MPAREDFRSWSLELLLKVAGDVSGHGRRREKRSEREAHGGDDDCWFHKWFWGETVIFIFVFVCCWMSSQGARDAPDTHGRVENDRRPQSDTV
jgi:hypothetical protein